MANVRDSDTSLWLHNKLGTSNDLWSGGSICSQLNQDVLRNIRDCFTDLQSQVKLKLILSFLHIPRRNVEEWKNELEEILEIALVDSDQWISMIAEILKTYPVNGTINFQIEENSTVFTDVINELRKLVRKHGDQGILPLECLYLNKNALNAQVGSLAQPVKHFTLKRKPKSAALKAELLQKSNDASMIRKNTPNVQLPTRLRGLNNDTTPLKGIPSKASVFSQPFKTPNSVNRTASMPGVRNVTRPSMPGVRRDGGIKLLDIADQPIGRDSKRKKKSQEDGETVAKQKENEKAEQEANATPDYAAGLSLSVPPSPAPNYGLPTSVSTSSSSSQSTPLSTTETFSNIKTLTFDPSPTKVEPVIQKSIVNNHQPMQIKSNPIQTSQPCFIINQNPVTHHTVTLQQIETNAVPKKGLSLSKEQMAEAQEMFKNSNRVTRPEKALILGFMAGSRDNPCPKLGNVVTIKLSENQEQIQQPDGSVNTFIAETHYQMNYQTGEGKRIKKLMKVEQQQESTPPLKKIQQTQPV